MASNVRFLDQVPVSAYGSTTALTINTGSFMITGSASGSTLTFTKGDGTTFELFVSGSGSSGGTSVIANPGGSGDALSTISIDGTVYVISGSGGSGAGFPYTGSAGISGSLDVNGIAASIIGGELNVQNYTPITIGVITKSTNHRYYNTGSSNGYTIDGLESPYLNMYPGKTYRFITSSGAHPLKFYTDSSKTTEYTTNVTYGTDYAQIFVTEETPGIIYYQCGAHPYMGNALYLQGVTQVTTAQTASFISFDGNRPISNQDQPDGIKNVNFNASGLTDFINKVYFTNTAPEIGTSNFTIGEFEVSGSLVGVITASDAESGSQTLSYQTASSYTADQFRISSSGDFGYLNLNVKSTSSMNTFGSGSPAIDVAPLPIVVTDSFGEATEKTIYIRITPNTAPIWSSSPGVGNSSEITSSLSESSAIGNNKDQYYFRDSESDTIFIGSGSYLPSEPLFSDYFDLDIVTGGNPYVRLNQTAAPLDFDTYASYSFVLTASDQHYQDGDDPNSISYLPVQIEIVDNIGPSINPQDLTGINESGSAGDATSSPILASDPEGFSLFLTEFSLLRAFKNGVNTNITSSLSASSTNLFTASLDPFQAATTQPFNVTRKTGQFLNVDIADRYVYRATVRDDYNPISQSAEITIEIADHVANTVTTSPVFNIIESAITNERVKQTSTGIGGSDSTATAANSSIQRWTVVSTPDFIEPVNATGSITQFQLKSNLSGSATVGGDTITLQITASQDNFETTIQYLDKTIDVELLVAPSLAEVSVNSGNNLNTNGARPAGQNLVKININDGQPVGSKYDIDHSTWTFTPNAGQNVVAYRDTTVTGTSGSYYVSASANLAAGNYGYTASVQDVKGFRAGTLQSNFEILQAGSGTLTNSSPLYVIESTQSGAPIVTNPNGRTGPQADLDINYSPTYNGAAVTAFTSSNPAIVVNSSGQLSLGVTISGSATGSGFLISSSINWQDQYGNVGGPTVISASVTENQAPEASFTLQSSNLTASVAADTNLVLVAITDVESDTPFSASLGGASAADLQLDYQNSNSSSLYIQNINPLTTGQTFTYNLTVIDDFSKERTYSGQTIPIADPIGETYIYTIDGFNAGGAPIAYNTLNTGSGAGVNQGSLVGLFQSGSIGSSSFALTEPGTGQTVTKQASASFLDLLDDVPSSENGLSTLGSLNFSSGTTPKTLLILFPSASNLENKPYNLSGIDSEPMFNDSFPGSHVNGRYGIYYKNGLSGTLTTRILYFDLQNAYQGYSTWGMVFATGGSTNVGTYYYLADSGSAPS